MGSLGCWDWERYMEESGGWIDILYKDAREWESLFEED